MKKTLYKNKTLVVQYDDFADKFSEISSKRNHVSRDAFYKKLPAFTSNTKVLDLGCGDGGDIIYYQKKGAKIYGVDSSKEIVTIAKTRIPNVDIRVGSAENIPFPDKHFDIVLSKYALQTSPNLKLVFSEIDRVLKPSGVLLFLVTHPFRQYFEKKDPTADYFKQKIVLSKVFDQQITFREPTHNMSEYLSDDFLKKFDVQTYLEKFDPDAEKIDDKKYPGFFLIRAVKRKK